MSYDPNTADKFTVTYKKLYTGRACVGTISGTVITFGTEVVYNSSASEPHQIAYDPSTADKFVVAYVDNGNSEYGTAVVGTISGTAISYGTPAVFNASSTREISLAFDPNTSGNFAVAYKDAGNSNYGTAVVGTIS